MDRNELKSLDDNLCGIYKITSPTGKIYIGQSQNIKNRYRSYFTHIKLYDTKILRSLKKYGFAQHLFEIIELCDVTELESKERFYINKYNSLEHGLNTLDRVYTMIKKYDKNVTWTTERKKKHSKFMKDLWKDNPDYFRRDDAFIEKCKNGNVNRITARTKNGCYIKVSVDEFNKRDDLVGTTGNIEQPKLKKPVMCITDNKKFSSLKEAAKYYGLSNGNLSTAIKNKKGIGKRKFKVEKFFQYC